MYYGRVGFDLHIIHLCLLYTIWFTYTIEKNILRGVNGYCSDTSVNPHLFRLNMQAGASPDFFSI